MPSIGKVFKENALGVAGLVGTIGLAWTGAGIIPIAGSALFTGAAWATSGPTNQP